MEVEVPCEMKTSALKLLLLNWLAMAAAFLPQPPRGLGTGTQANRGRRRMIEENENNSPPESPDRPPVIMFDQDAFAREDIVDKKVAETIEELEKEKKNSKLGNSIVDKSRPDYDPTPYDYEQRPTGYSRRGMLDVEDEEDDPDWRPDAVKDDFTKVLKDIYVGSEYDSDAKKEARYVVRNITGFSVAIGIIFTIIWYAFPGRFISYKGDRNGDVMLPPINQYYQASPDDLLSKDLYNNRDTNGYFEDTNEEKLVPQWQDGTPAKPDQRIPMDSKPGVQTPFDPKGFWKPPTLQDPRELDM